MSAARGRVTRLIRFRPCERYGTPIGTEQVPVRLTWHAADPLPVDITAPHGAWAITRQALASGLFGNGARLGNVEVVALLGTRMILVIGAQRLVVTPAPIRGFLDATDRHVPQGCEVPDVDAVLDALLTGGAR